MWIFIILLAIPVLLGFFGVLSAKGRTKKQHSSLTLDLSVPGIQRLDPTDLSSVAVGNFPMTAAQRKRRSAGIVAYVGFNGSAKSATMIWDTLPDIAAGKKILSTVAIFSLELAKSEDEATTAWEATGVPELRPDNPLVLPYFNWIPFTDFRQLIDFRDGIVLMDEVTGIADSRDSMGLPVQVRNMLFQLRRHQVVLRWTTIDWSAADKRLRNATQILTYCRGFMPKFEPGKIWAVKRLFWLRTYDAAGFEDFTEARGKMEKNRPKPMVREWVRLFGGLSLAIQSYSSGSQVLSLGASTDAGLCMTCGGNRMRKKCSCSDHKEPKHTTAPSSPTAGGEERGGSGVATASLGDQVSLFECDHDDIPAIPETSMTRMERRAAGLL